MSENTPVMPAQQVYYGMVRSIAAKDYTQIGTYLAAYPVFATAGYDAFRSAYRAIPFIFDAIEKGDARLYDMLLQAGSSPVTPRRGSYNALLTLLREGDCSEERLQMLERALAHPDCAQLGKPEERTPTLTEIEQSTAFMHRGVNSGLENRRRAIFKTLLERTPQEALLKHVGLVAMVGRHQENFIWMMRALADRGLDLNAKQEKFSTAMQRLLDNQYDACMPALLAAGYLETREDLGRPTYNSTAVEQHALKILQEEAHRVRNKEISAQQLLLTGEGRPTWQARGMAVMGLLPGLFNGKDAEHFGTGESQAELLAKIYGGLHPQQCSAPVLRDAPLARPSDSAVVGYLRGGMADVTKGRVA